jgi:hypothetical protein
MNERRDMVMHDVIVTANYTYMHFCTIHNHYMYMIETQNRTHSHTHGTSMPVVSYSNCTVVQIGPSLRCDSGQQTGQSYRTACTRSCSIC